MINILSEASTMRLFVIGASGYIGGSISSALIKKGYHVTGLVRSMERAMQVKKLGIEPVIGHLEKSDLIEKFSLNSDAIINAGDAENKSCVTSILKALSGSNKPFIHTSGSSIVGDLAEGKASNLIFDEKTPFTALPGRTNRTSINQMVIKSAEQNIRSIVIAPSLIYGLGLGVNRNSIQLPWLIKLAQQNNCAHHVGAGENIWSNIHIEDLIDLYLLALQKAPSGSFYYAENGECSMRKLCELINESLGFNMAPKRLSIEDASKEWGEIAANYTMGSNSRVKSKYARKDLGWKPKKESIESFILSTTSI